MPPTPGTHSCYTAGPSHSPSVLCCNIPAWTSWVFRLVTQLYPAGIPQAGFSHSYLIVDCLQKPQVTRYPRVVHVVTWTGWPHVVTAEQGENSRHTAPSPTPGAVLTRELSPTGHPVLLLAVLPEGELSLQLSLVVLFRSRACVFLYQRTQCMGSRERGPFVVSW